MSKNILHALVIKKFLTLLTRVEDKSLSKDHSLRYHANISKKKISAYLAISLRIYYDTDILENEIDISSQNIVPIYLFLTNDRVSGEMITIKRFLEQIL